MLFPPRSLLHGNSERRRASQSPRDTATKLLIDVAEFRESGCGDSAILRLSTCFAGCFIREPVEAPGSDALGSVRTGALIGML